jgi:hypothetical protein
VSRWIKLPNLAGSSYSTLIKSGKVTDLSVFFSGWYGFGVNVANTHGFDQFTPDFETRSSLFNSA